MIDIRKKAIEFLQMMTDTDREILAENLAEGVLCCIGDVPTVYQQEFNQELKALLL